MTKEKTNVNRQNINWLTVIQGVYKHDRKESTNIDPKKGGFNSRNIWKLKKEMFPQCIDLPTAMLDKDGILQTDS